MGLHSDPKITSSFQERLRSAAKLCALETTITQAVAAGQSPGHARQGMFRKQAAPKRFINRFRIKRQLYEGHEEPTDEDLDIAAKCGKWSKRPSKLFLQDRIFADVLLCLERDPLSGVISPPLIGTEGVIPLSIISVIPTIMQHYYDVIVQARQQVILLTNYWQASDSARKVRDALIELSNRAGQRNERIVVKLMLDRGSLEQAYNNHAPVPPGPAWSDLHIPLPKDVPNLDVEIVNFHRPILGTFHTKLLVVDQSIALLNSNNIQDRPNVEMMTHLEGPVVLSLLDTALLSWHNPLRPPLPALKPLTTPFDAKKTFDDNPTLAGIDLVAAAKIARKMLKDQDDVTRGEAARYAKEHRGGDAFARLVNDVVADHRARRQKTGDSKGSAQNKWQSAMKAAAKGSQNSEQSRTRDVHPSRTADTHPSATSDAPPKSASSDAAPDALVDSPGPSSAIESNGAPPEARSNGVHPEEHHDSLHPLPPKAQSTPGADSENQAFHAQMSNLSQMLNAGTLKSAVTNLEKDGNPDSFAPHRLHKPHEPFPIAVVNRKPHGFPGHQDIRVPQDAAWLAGFRYAQESVFVQTPTLNAKMVVRAILQACRRGVQVTLWLDYGFNDKAEAWPFQGGTNQTVVKRLCQVLISEGKRDNLHVYWYTGRDQVRPLNAVHKTRNCHVKFMSVDGHWACMGNGNQDTQSWCHSQEVNIMIDSEQIVSDWMEQLRSNQNTSIYGLIGRDGIWRDEQGRGIDDIEGPPEFEKKQQEKAKTT